MIVPRECSIAYPDTMHAFPEYSNAFREYNSAFPAQDDPVNGIRSRIPGMRDCIAGMQNCIPRYRKPGFGNPFMHSDNAASYFMNRFTGNCNAIPHYRNAVLHCSDPVPLIPFPAAGKE